MSSFKVDTNYFDDSGVDLGSKLITKDYLISVYPKLAENIFFNVTPELWTWGRGDSGQLGTNDTILRSTPVTTFAGGSNWKQVSSGKFHTSAIKTDGTLWVWGYNSHGEIGNNDTTDRYTPVTTFAGGTDWKQVSCSMSHTTAIKIDGTLWIWGEGTGQFGKLGINNSDTKLTPVTTFAGGTNWKQVSAGLFHTSAIKTDGTLWVWGRGYAGQLGTNDTTDKSTPVTTFTGGTNWKQVSAGNNHTAAIKTDGTLWTWGLGSSGQLGTNNLINRSTPLTTFAGGTNWKQVSSGGAHTAAIKTDGTLWTWGDPGSGKLGRVAVEDPVLTPITTFAGGNNWADTPTTNSEDLYTLSAGYNFSAAIKTDGTLWTWGTNWSGYLGINVETGDPRYTPVTTFAGGNDWKQLSCGYFSGTAAIKTDGTLWLWGANWSNQLGINDNTDRYTPVTTFAGGTDWRQVSLADDHCAAIKTDGTLWTWGANWDGRLGTNDTIWRSTPVTTFAGGTNWKQVSCKGDHTSAIKTDGTLWTWGANWDGQLGTNDTTDKSTPVTTFAGGINWKQVSSGYKHIGAIKTDGTLWTWGYNGYCQLGINDNTDRYTPVTTFAGGTDWKQVNMGFRFSAQSAAVKTDGTLWTWGYNGQGQLGTNDIITRSTPVTTFAGGTNWKQVACGYRHTLALKDDGVNKQLFVFGGNFYGNLGSSEIPQNSNLVPSKVLKGTTNWKQVSAGNLHTAAIKTDGTLWVWGRVYDGQLGNNNNTTNRSTPITTFAGGTNWKQVSTGGYYTSAIRSINVI